MDMNIGEVKTYGRVFNYKAGGGIAIDARQFNI